MSEKLRPSTEPTKLVKLGVNGLAGLKVLYIKKGGDPVVIVKSAAESNVKVPETVAVLLNSPASAEGAPELSPVVKLYSCGAAVAVATAAWSRSPKATAAVRFDMAPLSSAGDARLTSTASAGLTKLTLEKVLLQ